MNVSILATASLLATLTFHGPHGLQAMSIRSQVEVNGSRMSSERFDYQFLTLESGTSCRAATSRAVAPDQSIRTESATTSGCQRMPETYR